MSNRRKLVIALGAGALAFPFGSLAQDASVYPSKAIRVIVPFPAGGATDIMARNIGQKLNELWKQPVVVENRPGGNGMIGADAVAKSAPDGYTYVAATIAHSANVSLFPKAPYQLQKDLQTVAILGLIPLVPVVKTESPVRALKDLIAFSQKQPLNGGSGGNGTAHHLTLELFKSVTGAKIQHIPYKGGAPAMIDLVGGQIDVIFALLPECLPYVKSGKLRALAVTSERRHPLLPDVLTTSEAGILGVEVTSWNGLMVSAGTPREIVSKINGEVNKIMAVAEMRSRLIEQGFQPAPMSVSEAEKFLKADVERWAKVIREANITAD